jgi:hypothetical protein
MFGKIAAFEFRYQLRNPVFWVAGGLFFLLAFASMTVDGIQIGDTANVHLNSPFAIAERTLILSVFFMFVSTAFVANVVVRDDETGFGPILRGTGVPKAAYLYGRYLGAFAAAALAFLAVPLAIFIGSLMPWIDPDKLGPLRPGDYAYAYLALGLPTLFVTSAGFFALATATRSMMATYVGVVGLLVAYVIATALTARADLRETAALVDPFGLRAFGLPSPATSSWSGSSGASSAWPCWRSPGGSSGSRPGASPGGARPRRRSPMRPRRRPWAWPFSLASARPPRSRSSGPARSSTSARW